MIRPTHGARALVAAVLACGQVLWAGGGQPAAPRAHKPALDAEARKLAAAARRRLGDDSRAAIDQQRHIVYVSAVDEPTFRQVVALLAAHHDAQQKLLFGEPFAHNVTVVLPTVDDYRKLVDDPNARGIYYPDRRTLVSVSYSEVLVHEFTHAVHYNDQAAAGQAHPIWLCEGLAMLLQDAALDGGRVTVPTGPLLPVLQKALRAGTAPSLERLISMDRAAFMADALSCYAEARYVMLYLHTRGRLRAFYDAYKAAYARDRSGRRALEQTLGQPLGQIQKDWRAWVLSQTVSRPSPAEQRPCLGVRMKQTREGVKVTALEAGSAAERAGLLRAGDLITSVSGHPIRVPAELIAAVRTCRPGQIIALKVRRDGRTLTIKHVLGRAGD
jgi:hypothetical protein